MKENERMEVWFEVLMEQNVSNEELCAIIGNIREVQKQAWYELKQRKPSPAELSYVIVKTKSDEVRKEAFKELLRKKAPKDDLIYVLINVKDEEIIKEAWRKLITKKLTNQDLFCIISHTTDPVNREAWSMLQERHPDEDDLHYMFPDTEL